MYVAANFVFDNGEVDLPRQLYLLLVVMLMS